MRALWECTSTQPLGKTVWPFLLKLRLEPPYAPAGPPLNTYPKETEMGSGGGAAAHIDSSVTVDAASV